MSKAWVVRLLAAALLLPAAILVLTALGRLLQAVGDPGAGIVLDRLALAGGVLWIFVLLGLLAAVAVRQVSEVDDELDQ